MKCLIFAAGLGTRLRPLTDTMPKALVPINGTPLLGITISRLRDEGATEIVVNVHHFADMVKEYLAKNDFGLPIRVSDESERLLDTGGGLQRALNLFTTEPDAPVLIHNVDILSNASLGTFYAQSSSCDAALMVSQRQTTRLLAFSPQMLLKGWVNTSTGERRGFKDGAGEANDYSYFAFSGIHLFSPRLAAAMKPYGEVFPIMDFYLNECGRTSIRGYLQEDLKLIDVGKTTTLQIAADFLQDLTQK